MSEDRKVAIITGSSQGLGAAIAKKLFDIYKEGGFKALKNALPENVILKPGFGPVFLNVYNNWHDIINPNTNNKTMTKIKTIRVSTMQNPARSTIQDSSPITLA